MLECSCHVNDGHTSNLGDVFQCETEVQVGLEQPDDARELESNKLALMVCVWTFITNSSTRTSWLLRSTGRSWCIYVHGSRWGPRWFRWASCWTGQPFEALPQLSGSNSVIRPLWLNKLISTPVNGTLTVLTAVLISCREDRRPPCWLRERIRCYRDKCHLGFSPLHIKCTA